MTEFVTRRQAAIRAERERRAEWEAADELENKVAMAHYEFEDWLEREQVKRQKYEEAMREKHAAAPRANTEEQSR
jgi:hypothetical protein